MSLASPKHIVVDLCQNKHVMVNAVQYDANSREIIVHVTDDGEDFTVLPSYDVSVKYIKADNKMGVVDCSVESDGTIYILMTEQMTAVAGHCTCEITIVTSDKVIHTTHFIINVKESVHTGEKLQSVDEFVTLEQTLAKAQLLQNDVNRLKTSMSLYMSQTTATMDQYMAKAERAQEIADQVDSAVVTAVAKANETSKNATNASNSATTASNYATSAANSASAASTSATKAADSVTTVNASATAAANSATAAASSATAAASSATAAKTSENTSKTYADAAQTSKESAQASATTATNKATAANASAVNAENSARRADEKADEMAEYADQSKSYAVGTNNEYRAGDVTDNAKYYYEQAKSISEGLQGALLPMGTVTFAQLKNQTKVAGYMYNISDEFTTDSTFKEGSGHTYPAGTNVYCTADNYWDCLAGTQVTGIKGNAESTYRKGNVNITPANIGLGNVENKSSATIRAELTKENVVSALGYEPPTEGKAYNKANATEDGLMSKEHYTKLEGIDAGANNYTHPTHTAKSSGLYKVTVDSSGHVSAATAVDKSDITALGIPAQDTTYSEATTTDAGLMSKTDKSKLNGIAENANNYSHPTSGVTAGTYRTLTVDANGHVTAGSNPTTTDHAIARFHGAVGQVQNSKAFIDDNGNLTLDGSTIKINGTMTQVTDPTVIPAFINGQSASGLGYTQASQLSVGSATKADTLDGLTATVEELNYMDGVTSNVQEQIDSLGKSVADGKELLATTISEFGYTEVASDATFEEIGTGISISVNGAYIEDGREWHNVNILEGSFDKNCIALGYYTFILDRENKKLYRAYSFKGYTDITASLNITLEDPKFIMSIYYDLYVLVDGCNIYVSTNGTTWTLKQTLSSTIGGYKIINGYLYLFGGTSGSLKNIWRCVACQIGNGNVLFTEITMPINSSTGGVKIVDMLYGGGLYLAFTATGIPFAYSIDGGATYKDGSRLATGIVGQKYSCAVYSEDILGGYFVIGTQNGTLIFINKLPDDSTSGYDGWFCSASSSNTVGYSSIATASKINAILVDRTMTLIATDVGIFKTANNNWWQFTPLRATNYDSIRYIPEDIKLLYRRGSVIFAASESNFYRALTNSNNFEPIDKEQIPAEVLFMVEYNKNDYYLVGTNGSGVYYSRFSK